MLARIQDYNLRHLVQSNTDFNRLSHAQIKQKKIHNTACCDIRSFVTYMISLSLNCNSCASYSYIDLNCSSFATCLKRNLFVSFMHASTLIANAIADCQIRTTVLYCRGFIEMC